MGKMFQNASSLKPLGLETKLPRNDHWKVLYTIYVCYVDRESKMAATAIHILTKKCSNAFFSETNYGQTVMFIGWSSTNCTFFVPKNSKWRLPGLNLTLDLFSFLKLQMSRQDYPLQI